MKTPLNLTSTELQHIQSALDSYMKREFKKEQCDYLLIEALAPLAAKIDEARRESWNDEKFGTYDDIANEFFDSNPEDEYSSEEEKEEDKRIFNKFYEPKPEFDFDMDSIPF